MHPVMLTGESWNRYSHTSLKTDQYLIKRKKGLLEEGQSQPKVKRRERGTEKED